MPPTPNMSNVSLKGRVSENVKTYSYQNGPLNMSKFDASIQYPKKTSSEAEYLILSMSTVLVVMRVLIMPSI